MEFGVCADPREADWIRDAGADFLEAHVQNFLKPADETWEPAVPRETLPLPVAGYNCFLPGSLRVTGPGVDAAALGAYAERACRRAAAMGSDFIVFGSGGARNVPEGFPRARAEEQLVEALRLAGPIARAAGVTIVLEPLNRRESNIVTSVPEGLAYVRRAAAPGVGLLCDFYHLTADGQPLDDLDGARDALAHVHIAEPAGRVAPGPGRTDLRPFFRRLRALGYDRRISIECNWRDMKSELRPALDFLRREWAAA